MEVLNEGVEATPSPEAGGSPAPARSARLAAGFDRAIDRLLGWWASCRSWLPLALAIGCAPGLFVWPLLVPGGSALLDNQLPGSGRWIASICIGSSLLLAVAGYLVAALRAKEGWADALRRWNERLLPLLILPLLPLLLVEGIETKRPWAVIGIAAAGALAVGVWAYRHSWPWPSLSLPRWLPATVAFCLAGGWVLKMCLLAIAQHHGLETEVYDLGIYDSIFWHSIHGEPLASDFIRGGNHVSGHVDPLLVLLSPLYLLYPRAESILVLQVVWVAAGAIPLWLLAKRFLGAGHALALVVVYLLLPSVHGRTLYHFHSLTLAGPLLLWCFACLELKWLRAFWVALALLLLTREDMSLLAGLLGAYAIVGKGYRRLGVATILVAVAYLAFVKLAVMPDSRLLGDGSSDSYGFAFYYKDMIPEAEKGTLGLLSSLVTNPAFVLQHVVTEAKLRTFALLFLPLLLLPFAAPRGKMLLSYGLAFVFLASREPVFSIGFQYATVLDSFAIGVAVIAIAEIGRLRPGALDPARARRALTAAMVVASVVLSAKFGAILPSTSFRAGFHRLVREPSAEVQEKYAWVRGVIDRIGPTASVSASSKLGPHISNRSMAYLFPDVRDADFVFLERSRLKGKTLQKLRSLEKEGKYRTVDEHRAFLLLERADRLPAPAPPDSPAQRALPLSDVPVQRALPLSDVQGQRIVPLSNDPAPRAPGRSILGPRAATPSSVPAPRAPASILPTPAPSNAPAPR